jgi:hypothetical protein
MSNIDFPLLAVPAMIAAAQWGVLSRRFGLHLAWAASFNVAWIAAMWCGMETGFIVPNPLVMGAVGGGLTGVMQWIALRHQTARAMWCVPASVVFSIAGCWIGVAAGNVAYSRGVGETGAYLIGGAVAAVVIAAITAPLVRGALTPGSSREAQPI